ncbi:MAG: AarF/UbiB family protein [Candidatus Melainabacteria bacterium]|nr:AarF/UbiB family protein [Candidatus Melainabacteria bacterium]
MTPLSLLSYSTPSIPPSTPAPPPKRVLFAGETVSATPAKPMDVSLQQRADSFTMATTVRFAQKQPSVPLGPHLQREPFGKACHPQSSADRCDPVDWSHVIAQWMQGVQTGDLWVQMQQAGHLWQDINTTLANIGSPTVEAGVPAWQVKRGAFHTLMEPLEKALQDPWEAKRLLSGMYDRYQHDDILKEAIDRRLSVFHRILTSPEFYASQLDRQMKILVGAAGVGAGKVAQILSDDPRVPERLRRQLEAIKSDGLATRTPAEAQEDLDQLFPVTGLGQGMGQYEVIGAHALGVGTVGETWRVRDRLTNEEQVVKIIKLGVTEETLEEERMIWKAFARVAFANDPKAEARAVSHIDNLFNGWIDELDLCKEKQGAEGLARHAKRYRVAPVKNLAVTTDANGVSRGAAIVFDVAPGIQLSQLFAVLEDYRALKAQHNLDIYRIQHKALLKQYPWLRSPDAVINKLPSAYLSAQNEQAMFIRQNRQRVSHGDPHMGNVFVNLNEKGQLQICYIDTGLTVARSSQSVTHHDSLALNNLLANTREFSTGVIRQAGSVPREFAGDDGRSALAEQLHHTLNQRLYQSGIDFTDPELVNTVVENTMEELGVNPKEDDTIFLKSQLQTFMTYQKLSQLAGSDYRHILKESIPDVVQGFLTSLRYEPQETSHLLLRSVKEAARQPVQSAKVFFSHLFPGGGSNGP